MKNLKKYSAEDVPKWMPEWVHESTDIKKTKKLE